MSVYSVRFIALINCIGRLYTRMICMKNEKSLFFIKLHLVYNGSHTHIL